MYNYKKILINYFFMYHKKMSLESGGKITNQIK